MSVPVDIERTNLVRTALILEWLTLAWVLIEAAVAIWAGSQARSLSLIAFGADSLIEAPSACVLLWRLNVELRHGHAFSEDAERKASKIGGVLLFVLAVYVVGSAAWGLWTPRGSGVQPPRSSDHCCHDPRYYLLARRKLAECAGLFIRISDCLIEQWRRHYARPEASARVVAGANRSCVPRGFLRFSASNSRCRRSFSARRSASVPSIPTSSPRFGPFAALKVALRQLG